MAKALRELPSTVRRDSYTLCSFPTLVSGKMFGKDCRFESGAGRDVFFLSFPFYISVWFYLR